MDWMSSIIEEKIQEAIRKGEFDNLPGAGRPLQLEDASGVPEELRASYKLLKNAGMIPEEMQIRKEMVTLEQLIACCRNDQERARLNQQLSLKKMRYQSLMEVRGWSHSATFARYEDKLREKLLSGEDGGGKRE